MVFQSHPDEIVHLTAQCTDERPCRICAPLPTFRPAPYSAADVRLAAAAPDLLYACITAAEVLEPMLSPCESDCECVLHLLNAAIAKAQGAA